MLPSLSIASGSLGHEPDDAGERYPGAYGTVRGHHLRSHGLYECSGVSCQQPEAPESRGSSAPLTTATLREW